MRTSAAAAAGMYRSIVFLPCLGCPSLPKLCLMSLPHRSPARNYSIKLARRPVSHLPISADQTVEGASRAHAKPGGLSATESTACAAHDRARAPGPASTATCPTNKHDYVVIGCRAPTVTARSVGSHARASRSRGTARRSGHGRLLQRSAQQREAAPSSVFDIWAAISALSCSAISRN